MRLLPLGRQTGGNPDWELRIGTDNDTGGGNHGKVDILEVGGSGKRLTYCAKRTRIARPLQSWSKRTVSVSRHTRRLGYTFGRSTFAK